MATKEVKVIANVWNNLGANKKMHANIHFFFSSQGKGPESCNTPWILFNQISVSVFQSRFMEIHMSFVASEIKAFYPNFFELNFSITPFKIYSEQIKAI